MTGVAVYPERAGRLFGRLLAGRDAVEAETGGVRINGRLKTGSAVPDVVGRIDADSV